MCILTLLALGVLAAQAQDEGIQPGSATHQVADDADDVLGEFQGALAGSDFDRKRQAVRALAASPQPDAVVLPLLIMALDDRQAADDAVTALRARTGLAPPIFNCQSRYPDYPANDHSASWRYWLREWQADHQQEAAIDAVLREAREADAAASRVLEKATSEGAGG